MAGRLAQLALALLLAGPAAAGQVIWDPARGVAVAGVEAEALRHPASTAKLMTLMVVLDAVAAGEIAWDAPLSVSPRAAATAAVNLGLAAGQTIPLATAVHAVLVLSSNDAAVVLAEAVAGSEAAFAARMTARGAALGLTRSVWRNATGLPNRAQVTSARDLGVLLAALDARHGARLRPLFRAAVSWRGRSLSPRNNAVTAPEGAVLGKTGFTCDAGYTGASLVEREGRRRVLVTLANRDAGARAARLDRLARGTATGDPLGDRAPVVLTPQTCGAGSGTGTAAGAGGWQISLGAFRTQAQARAALSRAGGGGRVVPRPGSGGYTVLLSAPNRRAAVERAQSLQRRGMTAHILIPKTRPRR